jgi:hypothetical protein
MKAMILAVLTAMLLGAVDMQKMQFTGVETTMSDLFGEKIPVTIRREIPRECFSLELDPAVVFGGKFAGSGVPAECKVSHVSTLGHLYPMKAADGVETVGELEVLAFIKGREMNPGSRLLIDSRGSRWFERITIPSAINIPFIYIKEPEKFKGEFTRALERLGVAISDGGYDFTSAKELLIFCNGPWCSSSPEMIKALLKVGYPAKKILWYRGGLHDWTGFGMTVQIKSPAEKF